MNRLLAMIARAVDPRTRCNRCGWFDKRQTKGGYPGGHMCPDQIPPRPEGKGP